VMTGLASLPGVPDPLMSQVRVRGAGDALLARRHVALPHTVPACSRFTVLSTSGVRIRRSPRKPESSVTTDCMRTRSLLAAGFGGALVQVRLRTVTLPDVLIAGADDRTVATMVHYCAQAVS
jgi:hypothetical protein